MRIHSLDGFFSLADNILQKAGPFGKGARFEMFVSNGAYKFTEEKPSDFLLRS